MKRFFCLILILLLGGCASYYRFRKVAVEAGGINVYRAVFCPRGPRLYSCALDYAGTEADYDGVPLDVEVEPAKDSI